MPTPNEMNDLPIARRSGWIGVDLDGTLAHYDGWKDGAIGEPIPDTVNAVKALLAQGVDVRIVTARACQKQHLREPGSVVPGIDQEQVALIQDWCEKHIGRRLPVQFWKDFSMIQLWDDRAIQFVENTGQPVMHSLVLLKNLCVQIYDCLLRGTISGKLVEALRESCGIEKPKPAPLIVEAKTMPLSGPHLAKR